MWDRVLIAGVGPLEMLLAHIISGSVFMIFQSIQYFCFTVFVFHGTANSSFFLVALMLLLVGFTAILYGLGVSIYSNTYTTATFLSSSVFLPIMSLSGEA